ncbi:8-amino-7-oxononanoate synthase [Stomatohabitans albus]|uniref:aminotransferase class I/II-fold pyridoxal phosphate-dependent enzyme n=1 Tax=Stomatohabitans albus TaxID=3110766 RepID=UPI00300DB0E1
MNLDAWAYEQLLGLRQAGTQRQYTPVTIDGPWATVDEERRLNFASNDYLGIASDPIIRQHFHSEAHFSASSARLQTGTHPEHLALEHQASLWWGRPVLSMGSGWHANVGVLSTLANRDTTVYTDRLVHASILDGIRLSGAHLRRYRHNDLDHLAELLATHSPNDRVMVVTESIFSMDGDEVDLAKWVEITKIYPHVITVVDEAHAVGVTGPRGRGVAAREGVSNHIDVLIAPLGKAMASVGSFVGCSEPVKDLLISTTRSFLFSTALPPIQAAWTGYALDIVSRADDRRGALTENQHLLANGIQSVTGQDTSRCTHIIPILVGENTKAKHLASRLQALGWQVMAIVPPTVPERTSRVRLSVRADMPTAAIHEFLNDLRELWTDQTLT